VHGLIKVKGVISKLMVRKRGRGERQIESERQIETQGKR
jgi:hypothetical protein